MKYSSLALWLLPAILATFQYQVNAAPNPASSLDIGDIPAAILNLLLSPGIQVYHMNIQLSVCALINDSQSFLKGVSGRPYPCS